MFRIITDTAANLPCQLAEKRNILIIPFSYYIDNQEYICTDTEGFDGKAFFDKMRFGIAVTTSQVTPQRYMDFMEPILAQGEDILYISLSSGVSGSYNAACSAKQELSAKYPRRNILLIDSLGASLGEGLLALLAADYRDLQFSLEETYERILMHRDHMYQVFTVDNLAYLRRSGRLSNISALVGSLLNIKPLLKGNHEGKIVAFAKLRGRKRALQAMAEKYAQLIQNSSLQTVGIAHADCPEDAEHLISLLKKISPAKNYLTVCYEPVTGSHVGPGTLALFFEGGEGVRYH